MADSLFQYEHVIVNIRNRGPDHFKEFTVPISSSQNAYFAASVLHTQGAELAEQPIILVNGDILLWNGDVFGGKVVYYFILIIYSKQFVLNSKNKHFKYVYRTLRAKRKLIEAYFSNYEIS